MATGRYDGADAGDIYDEFRDAAVADSRFVAAGVFATTRAQEYGYSLLYAGVRLLDYGIIMAFLFMALLVYAGRRHTRTCIPTRIRP
mgnify:CR=1 FL=1